jgi:DNA-3-methyladenine glycosylase I
MDIVKDRPRLMLGERCNLLGLRSRRRVMITFGLNRLPSRFPNRDSRLPMPRCFGDSSELYARYHDEEWGVPVHDDQRLFEFLILEGAQAGLSWSTILNKRENYRRAFSDFDAARVARYTPARIDKLLQDPGIVRNRLKVAGTVKNAKAFLDVRREFGTFDAYIWTFVGGKPRQNRWRSLKDVPPRAAESDAMSKDLKRRGFTFVGSTICYAFMQAVGMVNDHALTCPRHDAVAKLG